MSNIMCLFGEGGPRKNQKTVVPNKCNTSDSTRAQSKKLATKTRWPSEHEGGVSCFGSCGMDQRDGGRRRRREAIRFDDGSWPRPHELTAAVCECGRIFVGRMSDMNLTGIYGNLWEFDVTPTCISVQIGIGCASDTNLGRDACPTWIGCASDTHLGRDARHMPVGKCQMRIRHKSRSRCETDACRRRIRF